MHRPFLVIVASIVAVCALLFILSPAFSHQAVSGWEYPISCCAGYDCAELAADRVSVSAGGYVIDGKFTVPYSETRNSPDGLYHACFPQPDNLKCFWAPPPGS